MYYSVNIMTNNCVMYIWRIKESATYIRKLRNFGK